MKITRQVVAAVKNKKTALFEHVTADVTFEIDMDRIAVSLGQQAIHSERHKAEAMNGAVTAEAKIIKTVISR